MRKKWLSGILALLTAVSFSACSAEEPVMPVRQTPRAELTRPTIGENYYGYVNFDYLSKGQIPYDQNSYGTMKSMEDKVKKMASDVVDKCVKNESTTDPIEQCIRELYLQYYDEEGREKAGIDVLMPIVGMIEACQTTDELVDALGVMYQEYGVSSFFQFTVRPDDYTTSIHRLTLCNMYTCGNLKENFTKTDAGPESMGEYLERALKYMKVEPSEVKNRVRKTVSLINEIMLASMDYADMMNVRNIYNLYSPENFEKLYSNIDTKRLMKAFGYEPETMIVFDVGQAEKINELFKKDNLRMLQDYALLCLMFDYSQSLPPSMQNEIAKTDKDERDKNAKSYLFRVVENELGVLFGREYFTEEVEAAGVKLTNDLKESCRDLIQKSERLGADSKNKFLKKLDNIRFLMGYNKDAKLEFQLVPAAQGGNPLVNHVMIKKGKVQADKAKLGQPVDRDTWGMSALQVNAVYNPSLNNVTIPAIMFCKPLFDPEKSEYTNMGLLGYVIAHEMHHAFDSNGFKYNETGRFKPEWLSKTDRDKFLKLQEKAINYYDHYKLLDVYHVNGEQTLSENLADLGAVQCLANTTDDKENLRLIFEAVAVQWASLTTISDVVITIMAEIHSPGEARVNAVLASIDKFYDAYDIKETDKMYVAPENRIKVW